MFDAAPEDWAEMTVASLFMLNTPGFWGDDAGGSPNVLVLRSTNFKKGSGLIYETAAPRLFEAKKLAQKRLVPGDIILERSGGSPAQPVGRVNRFEASGCYSASNFMQILRPAEEVDSHYAFYLLESFYQQGGTETLQKATTGIRNLDFSAYLETPVRLPPLDEQKRIAAVLRSVDKSIECGEAVEKQAFKVLKQTMVASLDLEGEAGISAWQKARIGDLGKVQAGRQRAPGFTEGELRPYLRVANVFDGFIDTSDVLQMPFTAREYGEYRLVPGDILLNEGQSIELVGRAAMYLGVPEDCCFQNTLVRFRATQVPASFAYALIRTLYWTGRLSAIASRTTSVAHLGVARFANIRVSVPPPEDQRRIGELFSDLCAAHASHQAANERLKAVRRSIMADLLSGRVRVPA